MKLNQLLTDKKIEELYPEFEKYSKKIGGYMSTSTTLGGIRNWYDFLRNHDNDHNQTKKGDK